jgi:hypothetical protein
VNPIASLRVLCPLRRCQCAKLRKSCAVKSNVLLSLCIVCVFLLASDPIFPPSTSTDAVKGGCPFGEGRHGYLLPSGRSAGRRHTSRRKGENPSPTLHLSGISCVARIPRGAASEYSRGRCRRESPAAFWQAALCALASCAAAGIGGCHRDWASIRGKPAPPTSLTLDTRFLEVGG